MAVQIVGSVTRALSEAGIPAGEAYPGGSMPDLAEARAVVSLEKLDRNARSATVLVTVAVPVRFGGSACEETALRAGGVLEELGGICLQEGCRFDGYAEAYCVRVLGTFYGADVMAEWESESDFIVMVANTEMAHAVAFRAEQVVDPATGTPAGDAAWTFRLEEQFRRGQRPMPMPTEPFTVMVRRSGSTEIYTECRWTAVQMENTTTGLRQVRKGVARARAFALVE